MAAALDGEPLSKTAITSAQYQPAHTSLGCICEMIVFEDSRRQLISPLIGKGQIPLVQSSSSLNNEESGIKGWNLRSLSTTAKIPRYVAISHVRSQGLGNTEQNALPRCQLLRLQAFVNKLYDDPSDEILFWIDSICVPIERSSRRVAIKQMTEVFKKADKVLVLDSQLSRTRASSPLDCFQLIKHSTWLKRLWTVYEGALAKKLFFQFLQGSFPFRWIHEHRHASSSINDSAEVKIYESGLGNRLDQDGNFIAQSLELLVDDYKAAYGIQKRHAISLAIFQKRLETATKEPLIRALIRLGCFSFPFFQDFFSEVENTWSRSAVELIRTVYPQKSIEAVPLWTSDDHLLDRLGRLSNLAEPCAIPATH